MARRTTFDAPAPVVSAVTDYVATLKGLLRLQDWTIELDFVEEAKDAVASMSPDGNSKHAKMQFGREFWTLPADEMRQVLAHEMVHCHLFHLHSTVEDVLAETVTKKEARVIGVVVNNEVERATDALADAFAHLLPTLVLDQGFAVVDPAPLGPDVEPLLDADPAPVLVAAKGRRRKA